MFIRYIFCSFADREREAETERGQRILNGLNLNEISLTDSEYYVFYCYTLTEQSIFIQGFLSVCPSVFGAVMVFDWRQFFLFFSPLFHPIFISTKKLFRMHSDVVTHQRKYKCMWLFFSLSLSISISLSLFSFAQV